MSTKRKRSDEGPEATANNSDQDKDFQDFLDSVDDVDTKNDGETAAEEQDRDSDFENSTDSVVNEGSAEENSHQNNGKEVSEHLKKVDDRKLEEVQQVAYEARLAKLMLLSRRKKGDKNEVDHFDNTAREVGSGLVMNEEEANEGGKSSDLDETRPLSNPIGWSSLKYIMKKKKKKRSLNEDDLENDDAYWSNF